MKDSTKKDINLLINGIIKKTIDTYEEFDPTALESSKREKDLVLELKEYIFLSMYNFHLIEISNYVNYEENTTIH